MRAAWSSASAGSSVAGSRRPTVSTPGWGSAEESEQPVANRASAIRAASRRMVLSYQWGGDQRRLCPVNHRRRFLTITPAAFWEVHVRTWGRSCLVTATIAATLVATGLPAQACDQDEKGHTTAVAHTKGDPGAIKGVRAVGSVPDAAGAISVNFLQYRNHRDVMVVSGEFGLKVYDLTKNPAAPKLVGQVSLPGLWETEDTDVDQARKLVFLSRDPRAFGGNTHTGESGIYVVDVSTPEAPKILSFTDVPAGHTTTCVDSCRYLWTGGPAKADSQPADWGGRPIWVTDVRDPVHPKVNPNPIELARNDGKTDYVHDVQVDANGVAWASGRGGVRGHWVTGVHRDPLLGNVRRATANDPNPSPGGGLPETAPASRIT